MGDAVLPGATVIINMPTLWDKVFIGVTVLVMCLIAYIMTECEDEDF